MLCIDNNSEALAGLLDILVSGDGMAAVLNAYFDESNTHDGAGVMCVAGYVFTKKKCIKLDAGWRKLLDKYQIPYFRMSDCAHGAGVFDGKAMRQRIGAETKAINTIKKNAKFGFAASIDPSEYMTLVQDKEKYLSPYSWCVWTCLLGLRRWADETGFDGQISYVFEAGHQSQAEANWLMNGLFRVPELRGEYRVRNFAFVDKRDARPLQAADLLAWQHSTDRKRIDRGENTRKDYQSLLELTHYNSHVGTGFINEIAPGMPRFVEALGPRF